MPAEPMLFRDSWTIRAPISLAFETLADFRTYTIWGHRTYKLCEADGAPAIGRVSRVCIRGPLPMALRFETTIIHFDPPFELKLSAQGDFAGYCTLCLVAEGERVNVGCSWLISPRKPPPAFLAPLLDPLFRWNHSTSVTRANRGLQEYLDERIRATS